jgi:hypothetical protein
MDDKAGITKEELNTVTDILSKLQPGVLPFPIFHAITRLVATPIIEIVPLRRNEKGGIDILLMKRDANDPVWPGQLHVPGTVVRASDTEGSFSDAFSRILSKELSGFTTSTPVFVKNIIHNSGRGMEVSQIYWVEVSDSNDNADKFYDTDSYPNELVQSQLDFIPDAVQYFKTKV